MRICPRACVPAEGRGHEGRPGETGGQDGGRKVAERESEGAVNAYLGLSAGQTIAATYPAAVAGPPFALSILDKTDLPCEPDMRARGYSRGRGLMDSVN